MKKVNRARYISMKKVLKAGVAWPVSPPHYKGSPTERVSDVVV